MSKNYYACVITHGTLAQCLKKISEKLVAPSVEVKAFTNMELSLEEIEHRIWEDVNKQNPEKIIVFVDLAGGSCWLLANRIKMKRDNITVIGGVNVPLIVSFQMHVDRMDWDNLVSKIIEDGKKGIFKA
ncbi:MAG TPA: hypothetical protein ENK44_00180 [Caldithrix abyssi]|uniref:PTS EIIA type-4 domain-containing protein n=1 Tax=Caldithrix abyssi TaxID=187145 RepID=A0A7V4WU66_CALAY|nr:hypothetical protein [Caldithrix abyssi]